MLKPSDFFDLADVEFRALFDGVEFVWQALGQLPAWLEKNMTPAIRGEIAPTVTLEDNVFIGENTVVEPGAMIMGPTYIGRGCQIRQGAYIRGNCLIGDGAVVGHSSEIKSSLLLPGAGAPHFNYVGDSIVGRHANLGAGSILSNLKLTKDEVVITIEGQSYKTGMRKLGGIVGDSCQVGCNAVLNPGTLLGRGSLVYPCASIRGYFPPGSTVALRQDIKK